MTASKIDKKEKKGETTSGHRRAWRRIKKFEGGSAQRIENLRSRALGGVDTSSTTLA